MNNCTDTLNIGFGEYIDLDVFLMNNKKEWIKIDLDFPNGCGTGLALILLMPKQICLSYIPEFQKGNFKTKFRIKLRNAYSNTFDVSIDEKSCSKNSQTIDLKVSFIDFKLSSFKFLSLTSSKTR